ncbi:PilZ domain-containing protein [Neoroseomonas soli]|uniref:PilZ domain-containing protein n=1 Tax=Neoroseomonas soli TaxID=1081025 RepID=A0A9X9WUL6_9PROT|nr:PilZ domain-containing protein [Neoroseomonas soli]MBR0670845.1 PilZ domain-containing protein [Neoroseomonas soli]
MPAGDNDAQPEPDEAAPDGGAADSIAAALDERRDGPRFPLRENCTVFAGAHVHHASVRDVSAGGAMLHGVRGVAAGDLIHIRLARRPDWSIGARVRGVSLIGVHVAIDGAGDQAIWREALKDVLG